jgi:probable lipoprotein NlpC
MSDRTSKSSSAHSRLWRRILIISTAVAFAVGDIAADAPIAVASPKRARSAVVAAAYAYRGAPYLRGGTSASGFDCSGLVYRVFLDTVHVALPRTAKAQYAFCEPIPRSKLQPGDLVFFDTTGGISHVGIYTGENKFVHSPSEGSRTGVTENDLDESYWARTFVGAGRALPPEEQLGLIASASFGPSFGAYDFFRGLRGSLGASFSFWGLEAGLELRPSWDSSLEVLRIPAVVSLAIDRRLKLFAGPALTIGSPNLDGRMYEPSGGWLATAGLEYTFHRFRIAGLSFALGAEIEYDRYVAAEGETTSVGLDAEARLRAGLCLSLRWGI